MEYFLLFISFLLILSICKETLTVREIPVGFEKKYNLTYDPIKAGSIPINRDINNKILEFSNNKSINILIK